MTNKEFFQQSWRGELSSTLTALKALLLADKLDYKPAEKNRTAKQLVDHFVSHVEDLNEGIETGIINHRVMADYPSIENAIEVFEKGSEKLISLLDKVDEKTWNEQIVPLKVFGNTIGEYPLSANCWMFMHDIIHHRGQLSTYYRPMGITQPSIYGPTAEMVEEMMAKMTSAN